MASTQNKDVCTICEKVGLKPFTKENVFNYYIPLHGVVSYGALSVNVMNPQIVPKLLPKKDLTNVFLISAIVGSAFYIYGRPHLKDIKNNKRAAYALLGATLFSMGSVLAWALIKSALPKENALLATIAGIGSGAAIVKIGTDYIRDLDKLKKN
ncbi:uncharacterized protein LOC6578479 [Drosophila mojavensis]|uniref:Uncharacterized protein n=2 Tax=mojavensis species complex TaxID=198037 RepID=B4KRQ5_DROMO|nr:uncharacterized protein LOC6578479 [Drosophila mojavensis]XP_017868656.1 PREDICTED: uncharacterized protein LOC108617380 [Drosophila arizonae]EDW08325.1 uncharacterized protein Dmoj_GI19907 [Drosophila mojavensis]